MTIDVIAIPGGIMPAAMRYASLASALGGDVEFRSAVSASTCSAIQAGGSWHWRSRTPIPSGCSVWRSSSPHRCQANSARRRPDSPAGCRRPWWVSTDRNSCARSSGPGAAWRRGARPRPAAAHLDAEPSGGYRGDDGCVWRVSGRPVSVS